MKKRSKLLDAADELLAFVEGRNTEPLTVHLPDGKGGLVTRSIASVAEYRRLWSREANRAFSEPDEGTGA